MIDLIGDEKKRNKCIGTFLVVALASLLAALIGGVYDGEAHTFLERPGGMILFAFVGCWLLIIVAKLILTPLLQRDEDYYSEDEEVTENA